MAVPRSAEIANLEMRAHWSKRSAQPLIPPGSSEESYALSRIDDLRDLDASGMSTTHPDSAHLGYGPYYRRGASRDHLESRRAAATRYWRRRSL